MKTKLVTLICATAIFFTTARPAAADDLEMAADAIVVRPACFVATIVGSVLFVIALPVAATSHSVKHSARVLVMQPAHATFSRPLGDMESLVEDYH